MPKKTRKILFENKWLRVVELNGWFTATEPAQSKHNIAVAVLPYRIKNNKKEYLSRFELNPAHLLEKDKHQISIITGACETGDPFYHAKMELLEEAGYNIPIERFKSHGFVNPIKSSTTAMYLFSVRINNKDKRLKYSGDGSNNEAKEYSDWISEENMIWAKDPYIHTIMLRMKK